VSIIREHLEAREQPKLIMSSRWNFEHTRFSMKVEPDPGAIVVMGEQVGPASWPKSVSGIPSYSKRVLTMVPWAKYVVFNTGGHPTEGNLTDTTLLQHRKSSIRHVWSCLTFIL